MLWGRTSRGKAICVEPDPAGTLYLSDAGAVLYERNRSHVPPAEEIRRSYYRAHRSTCPDGPDFDKRPQIPPPKPTQTGLAAADPITAHAGRNPMLPGKTPRGGTPR